MQQVLMVGVEMLPMSPTNAPPNDIIRICCELNGQWVSEHCLDGLSDEIVRRAVVDYEEDDDDFDVVLNVSERSDDGMLSDVDVC